MSGITQKKLSVLVIAVVLVVSAVAVTGVTLAGEDAGNAGQDAGNGEQPADELDTQSTSYLRVLHASPDAPAVDVAVDNETVLTGVQFGNVSDYLEVASGPHNVTISVSENPDAVVFDQEVIVDQRSITTFVAAGEVSENATKPFSPVGLQGDPWKPDENESAIRIAHFSPDAPTVDVTAGNGSVVIADNVSYGNASEYVSVPAGNYTAEIRPATATNDGPVVTTVNVSLEGETATTAFALGYLSPDEAPAHTPFQVLPVEDATVTIHLPGEEPDEQGEEARADEAEEAEDDDSDAVAADEAEDEDATRSTVIGGETVRFDEDGNVLNETADDAAEN